MKNDEFKKKWKEINFFSVEKKLSAPELRNIRTQLVRMDNKKVPYSNKVNRLQNQRKKLKDKWKAERVVRTEEKKIETDSIKTDAQELGFNKFKIVLSANACQFCRATTEDGNKIFRTKDLKVKGRDIPPIHPNCNCLLLPLS